MADICKCKGKHCDKKENCFRYIAKDGYRQSYFAETPTDANGKCEYYWAVNENIDLLNELWSD